MRKFIVGIVVGFIFFTSLNLSHAIDSRPRIYGSDHFDFSLSTSCAVKDSSVLGHLDQVASKLREDSPLIININGKSCRVHEENRSAVAAIIDEISSVKNKDSYKKAFKKSFQEKELKNYFKETHLEFCELSVEAWVIASFAKKSIQPYDVAGIGVRYLSEIKLLLFGGGFVAGIAGDSIGAACMSVIGAGVDYACNKGWLYSK